MKELFLSNCEKKFIQKLIAEGQRLDGRNYNETRNLQISFGSEYGSCIVSLGATRVLAQVSCEIVQPKQIRPNEGILYINVEVGPMAAPHFEPNRQTDLSVYLNRLLEKCFKDSKCLDLESLCIVVEEKVWSLRVDIKVMNHAGNLIECASIATLASIAHFKRPDVTRSGDNIIIHTLAEKDPIPTVLYHYPVCLTFAIFGTDILISDPNFIEESVCTSNTEEGINTGGGLLVVGMNQYRELCLLDLSGAAIYGSEFVHRGVRLLPQTRGILISDPSFIEESVCTSNTEEGINTGGGLLVVGMNQYRELCLLDLSGAAIYGSELVHRGVNSAGVRSKEIVDLIKQGIVSDDALRQKRMRVNFSDIISRDHILSLSQRDLNISLRNFKNNLNLNSDDDSHMVEDEQEVEELSKYDVISTKQTVETVQKEKTSNWIEISSESEEE